MVATGKSHVDCCNWKGFGKREGDEWERCVGGEREKEGGRNKRKKERKNARRKLRTKEREIGRGRWEEGEDNEEREMKREIE